MSLPDGFLDELRSRTSIVQVVGRKVMWDTRKSNQGKGDMWAPCPFHQEKTASFHVDDRKGFYKCFGCGAAGDAIKFVRETENMGFMEAVEVLAQEAGLQMPARDPQAARREETRRTLADVMEEAVRHYRMMLQGGAAAAARTYLAEERGLSPETLDRFEIGFAPDDRQGIFRHLTAKGVDAEQVIAAGLSAKSDRGGAPYDRFRDRILFPIRDARGRCIAFGGRAMSPEAQAKYLNSPQTELFDKGRNLYNHGPARSAAGQGQTLIVAEGYMDVIALVAAGFEATVAPLGTAVTEAQLDLLWRISPEPVIALDGDAAGLRAAMRVMDLALPKLAPERRVRFALMPPGKDPDDLIREGGPDAMAEVLSGAKPLIDLLWKRETDGKVIDSPDRRAALETALKRAVARIEEPVTRNHHERAVRDLLFQHMRASRPQGHVRKGATARRGGGWQPAPVPLPRTRASSLAGNTPTDPTSRRRLGQAVVLATLIRNPSLIATQAHALEGLRFEGEDHTRLAAAVLSVPDGVDDVETHLSSTLGANLLESVLGDPYVQLTPAVRRPGQLDMAELCIAHELAQLTAMEGVEVETEEAVHEVAALSVTPGEEVEDSPATWRMNEAKRARDRAMRAAEGDKAEFDVAANGVRLDRDERAAFRALVDGLGVRTTPNADSDDRGP